MSLGATNVPVPFASELDSMRSMSKSQLLVVSQSRIFSTGRNCKCLCGWLAPLLSPELKKANKRFCLLSCCHAFKQAYVASRSSCSRRCVCFLLALVARMKCPAIMGNLLRTSRWLGFSVGMSTMWRSVEGLSKGSKCVLGGFLSSFGIGFFASDGQYRSWNWHCQQCI